MAGSASSAAVVALRDQIAGAASKIARLNELETIRQDVFVTACRAANEREAEAMNNVADRLALLVASKVPALNPAKMSPEQRLVAELQLYKREEAERLSAIARHEDEIRAGQARLADAQREHSTVARQVLDLKQQLRVREVRPTCWPRPGPRCRPPSVRRPCRCAPPSTHIHTHPALTLLPPHPHSGLRGPRVRLPQRRARDRHHKDRS